MKKDNRHSKSSMVVSAIIGAVLGGAFGALVFGSVEGWYYYSGIGLGGYYAFDTEGLVWVAVGMIAGSLIAIFCKKLLTAIKLSKSASKNSIDSSSSIADEIQKYKEMLDNNTISQQEFEDLKRNLIQK